MVLRDLHLCPAQIGGFLARRRSLGAFSPRRSGWRRDQSAPGSRQGFSDHIGAYESGSDASGARVRARLRRRAARDRWSAGDESGAGNRACRLPFVASIDREMAMGRGILLWLLGVPIPIILLLALLWH
jgi:hypothetical protein